MGNPADERLLAIMRSVIGASPIFGDTEYYCSAENGKVHVQSFGPYGQGLLSYIGSDSLYVTFYYSREQTWLDIMVNLGVSKSSPEKSRAIDIAIGKIRGEYRRYETIPYSGPGGCSFSFSANDVMESDLEMRLRKMVGDAEDILKATLNPAYYQ